MDTVLTTKDINHKFLYKKGFCGLTNLGNTCFMNSILQCINNTVPLLEFMFSQDLIDSLNKSKDEHQFIIELRNVMVKLWEKNSVCTPDEFLKEVHKLSVKKNRNEFTGYGQNDSQEFLQFLLEMLHNGLTKEVSIEIEGTSRNKFDKLAKQAYTSFKEFFENDYSHILNLFYGQYFSYLETKTNDKYEKSFSFEPFNMISLNISSEADDLYACLNNFVSPEIIINTEERKIKKTVHFWSLPDILIIFLKRYNNDLEKIDSLIDFPIDNLDMSDYIKGYDEATYQYALYAVCNHGGGLGGGHYWAYVKNLDDNWYKFNDNVVSTLSKEKVVSENAYCLFYRKVSIG